MIPASPLPAQNPLPHEEDWRRLWRASIREPAALLASLGLESLAARIAPGQAGFPLRVPASFVARMRHGDAHDPLLRQVLPLDEELRIAPGFALDAVGDGAAKAGRGVIHKYEGRALLIATGSCAIHCRYCFRRHFPYAEETAASDGWQPALDALRGDPSITEVILSGGDPLSLSTAKLGELTEALAGIAQLRRLRIHTRLPVALPERVDAALSQWLGDIPLQKIVVLHANHGNEIDAAVTRACADLRASGAHLLNQAVLLRGVNDSVEALAELSEKLFAAGVLPYYLHQLDRVVGAAHFEVPDSRARELVDAVRARLPGYLVPRLVREVAGEAAKQPL
ncbi:MAG: EF-P beta-lysylation protein EpmB [Lysobacteraceae bacterium]